MSILGLSITDTKPVIEGAGFWIRALARILDTAFGYLVGTFSGLLGGVALGILQGLSIIDPGWQTGVSGGGWLLLLMSLVGNVCYHTFSEGIGGASLGKLICGLRVLSEDRSPCGLKAALIRSLAYFIDSLFFGVIGYMEMKKTPMEQRHGDNWARTVVVRKSLVPEASRRTGMWFLLAIAAGTAAWSFCLLITIVGLGLIA